MNHVGSVYLFIFRVCARKGIPTRLSLVTGFNSAVVMKILKRNKTFMKVPK